MGFDFTTYWNDKKYLVKKDFSIRCGSHTRNPNGTNSINVTTGNFIYHRSDANDGHVWFYAEIPNDTFDYSKLGFIMAGEIKNMINRGMIEKAP